MQNPSYIDGDTALPEIIANKLPAYIGNIEQNWNNCTTSPFTNCPLHEWYAPIKLWFDKSYELYRVQLLG